MSEKKKFRSGRRSRAISLSPTHSQQTTAIIEQLESSLREKDAKIKELEERLQSQEKQLEHRLLCMERLQRERDELRKTNASLIEKTAELTRKQSVGSFGSPSRSSRVSRSYTVRQALPPTPDLEPSSFTPPARRTGLDLVNRTNSGPSPQVTFVIPPTVDSDDSDMEEEEAIARANYNSQQNGDVQKSSSEPVVDVNPMQALPVKSVSVETAMKSSTGLQNGGPAKSATGKQLSNGTVKGESEERHSLVQDDEVALPKSSGSGAIAQHVKKILEKRNTEKNLEKRKMDETLKETAAHGVDNSVMSNGPVTSDTRPPPAISERQASIASTVSEVPSELTNTEIESSIETSTSLSPTSSIHVPRAKSKIRWSGIEIINDSKEEQEDEEEDPQPRSMRARTHTLAAVHSKGRKPMERGRRMLKELKKEEKNSRSAIKRQSSLTNLNRRLEDDDLELISPQLAAWVRGKFIRDLEKKYGGRGIAQKAAICIQRAYREYKLRSRFKQMRLDKHRRNRAQSMRTPGRRPSILQKNRPLKYRREKSNPDARDPAMKAREAASMLSRERIGHSHSGARLDLVQQKRKEAQGKVKELAQQPSLDESLESAPPDDSTQVVVNIEGVCESETSTDSQLTEKPDGITPSLSADSLPRPVSIFSSGSTISSKLDESPKLRSSTSSASTLPSKFRAKKFSIDSTNQKKNIGVNHFNRKPTRGIQYLVMSDILEDDPRCVAEFLMNQYGLSKQKIGEFLGEISSEFSMAVLECLVEHMEMGNKPIDEALRQFQQIFRMPGEAQKIDKIMEVFAMEYYKANKDTAVIRSEDAAYMLSFAIMMLHTSLHNPSVRSRITKKQWVSMNRGCNEGEHFPESTLMEVYDRILTHEFTTGADHTDEVVKIEKQINGLTIQKLADPQRRLLGKFTVHEVADPNSRSYRAHWRALFVFSDLFILCKHRGREYAFRDTSSLFNVLPIIFDTHYHKYGIQVYSSMEDKVVLQCSCESLQDREQLLGILEEATAELKIMETERIAELGTSLAAKPSQEKILHGGSVKHTHRISRGPSDLIVDTFEGSGEHSGFVFGVGDIAVNTNMQYHAPLRDSVSGNSRENRSSGDSGFDSQQPTPSPSPTEPARYTPSNSPSPSHTTYLTPNPSLTSSPIHTIPPHSTHLTPDPSLTSPQTSRNATPTHLTPTSSQTASPTHLTPVTTITPPPRSKSSDAIRTLTIIPTSAHNRSPSADISRDRVDKGTASPKKVKKNNPKRDSSKKKSGLSFFGKIKNPSSPRRRGSSEATPSSRRGSYTPPIVRVGKSNSLGVSDGLIETRGRSSSSVDLSQTT